MLSQQLALRLVRAKMRRIRGRATTGDGRIAQKIETQLPYSLTGAQREAWEEAGVRLNLHGLHAVYSVPEISQVQIMYRATLREPGYAAGPESLEVAFFAWDRIPWDRLAFQTVEWALRQARVVADGWTRVQHVFANPEAAAAGAMVAPPAAPEMAPAAANRALGFEA